MRNGLSRDLLEIFVAPRSLPPVEFVTVTSNKQSQAQEGRLLVNSICCYSSLNLLYLALAGWFYLNRSSAFPSMSSLHIEKLTYQQIS
jgi:hypothetical protein